MTIELDEWDLAWLARPHTDAEYRAEIKSALERCAMYSARIDRLEAELEQLRGQRAGCRYPACLDGGGRCHAMFKGECAGPKQERTTI
jgi:hypothetical protein